MESDSNIDIGNQDIPLHTFRRKGKTIPEEAPFEYLNFRSAPALAQAAFPHRHDFYEIIYVTKGVGTHFIDFNAYPIEPNSFFFISPGQVHYWHTTVPLEGDILIFTDDFLLLAPADYTVLREFSFFHTVEGSPMLKLTETDHHQMSALLRSIGEEFTAGRFRAASVLRAYLHILLVQIQRICATQEIEAGLTNNRSDDTVGQKLARQFKQLITKQFMTVQSVPEYANQLGISVNHLNKTIKATTGYTPGKLIRQEMILEAKRLFQHTDLTTSAVGYRLGFEDPSYFGRFFKREVGMSPGQFRQDMY